MATFIDEQATIMADATNNHPVGVADICEENISEATVEGILVRTPRNNGYGDFAFGRTSLEDLKAYYAWQYYYHDNVTEGTSLHDNPRWARAYPTNISLVQWGVQSVTQNVDITDKTYNVAMVDIDNFVRTGSFTWFKLPTELRQKILRQAIAPIYSFDPVVKRDLVTFSILGSRHSEISENRSVWNTMPKYHFSGGVAEYLMELNKGTRQVRDAEYETALAVLRGGQGGQPAGDNDAGQDDANNDGDEPELDLCGCTGTTCDDDCEWKVDRPKSANHFPRGVERENTLAGIKEILSNLDEDELALVEGRFAQLKAAFINASAKHPDRVESYNILVHAKKDIGGVRLPGGYIKLREDMGKLKVDDHPNPNDPLHIPYYDKVDYESDFEVQFADRDHDIHSVERDHDFLLVKLIRDLSNVSTDFRRDLEQVIWTSTCFVLYSDWCSEALHALKSRPSMLSQIHSLRLEIRCDPAELTAAGPKDFKPLVDFIASNLKLQYLKVVMETEKPDAEDPDRPVWDIWAARGFYEWLRIIRTINVTHKADFLIHRRKQWGPAERGGVDEHGRPNEFTRCESRLRRALFPDTLRRLESIQDAEGAERGVRASD